MGLVWGLVVSVAGLVVLSVVAPPVTTGTLSADVAAGDTSATEDSGEAEAGAGADPVAGAAAAETAVGTVDLAGKSLATDMPTAAEGAVQAATDLAQAAPEVATTLVPTAQTGLAMTSPEAGVAAPTGDAAPAVSGGKPAAPPAPGSDPAPMPDAGTMPAPKQDKLLDPPAPPKAPQVEPLPQMPGAETETGLPQVPVAPEAATPDAMTAEAVAPESAIPEAVTPEVVTPETETLPKVALDPAGPGSQGSTLAPDAGLGTVAGVTTDRLPRIGDGAQATQEEVLVLDAGAGLPIVTYARAFVAEPGKPKFAILLRDIGAAGMARDDLARLPFAVTFVIDPAAPDAAEAASTYRAAGQEVMILASGLPEGATPADLEQSFQAMALALPETVAVLDLATGGLQENRLLATQAVPILKAQGRGIVTYDRGLGAAQQVAAREGLPHAVIFRELDAGGEDTPVIRRYLDRAAFKAAQEGQVLVIGQTRPETVAALLEWMVEGRGSSVQLAPVTAVMQAE